MSALLPEDVMPPKKVAGSRLAKSPKEARLTIPRWRGAPSTTHNAELFATAMAAAPTSTQGIVIGRDQLSHAIVAHDSVTAYQNKDITSPLVIVMGDVGSGKSSLIKTVYVLRALAMRSRRVVVIDKKDERGEGEYAGLTRQFGAEPIRMRLDSTSSTLNPLDPVIAGQSVGAPERVVQALIENIGGVDLGVWERKALRHALRTAQAQHAGRAATLGDMVAALSDAQRLPDGLTTTSAAADRYLEAALSVRFTVEEILESYGRMFDGETSSDVNLSDKLTTFDVSQLPDAGPAVAAVVGVAHGWLMGKLRTQRGMMTHFIAEEGWHLLNGPNARVIGGDNVKLARGLGLVIVFALHKPADIELNPAAAPVFAEAQTVHIFANARRADARRCIELFDLSPSSEELITRLRPGQHLLKIGARPEIHVAHVRSELEEGLTNTDAAMTAAAL